MPRRARLPDGVDPAQASAAPAESPATPGPLRRTPLYRPPRRTRAPTTRAATHARCFAADGCETARPEASHERTRAMCRRLNVRQPATMYVGVSTGSRLRLRTRPRLLLPLLLEQTRAQLLEIDRLHQ